MILVTRTFMPDLEREVMPVLREVWARGWVTNDGPVLQRLEARLADRWAVDVVAVCNGTLALQLAIVALGLRGRVLTTPFTFPATSSSLVWQGCEPVLVDIDPDTWNIDPAGVQQALDDEVSGVAATHVFGNPCDVEALDRLDVPVLYDAAHAVDVQVGGRSLFAWGTLSATSFHATKVFHTVEGGAVVTTDAALAARVRSLRNFGTVPGDLFRHVGINGKVSELHAGVGLAVLAHLDAIVARRRALCERYRRNLEGHVQLQRIAAGAVTNGAYMPVVFPSEDALLGAVARLDAAGVQPRRYFHPSLSQLPWMRGGVTPVADHIARTVLCLPIYYELDEPSVDRICDVVIGS